MGFMDTVSSVASSMLKGVTGAATETGEVVKAKIIAYEDSTFGSPISGAEIVLPLISNDGIKQKFSIDWGSNNSSAQGESFPTITTGTYKWNTDALELQVIVDATGVFVPTSMDDTNGSLSLINYTKPNIEPYIKKLKQVVYCYDAEKHGPPFLELKWGKIFTASASDKNSINGIYRCVLEEMEVNYTLFSNDGAPVRAEVSLTLKPFIDATSRPQGASPDLSHIIEVKYGDNLPKLCKKIYDSPEYYHQIAKVNGLQSAYDLEPGMRLLFPPLDKFER